MAEPSEGTIRLICGVVWRLLTRLILVIAGVYLLIKFGPYVLYRLGSIIVSVIAAVVLTYALLPAVEWLSTRQPSRRGVSRARLRLGATILVFLVFLGLVALSIALFISPFQQELKQFSDRVGDYTKQLGEVFRSASDWYNSQVPPSVKKLIGKLDYSRLTAGLTNSFQQLLRVATSSIEYALELVLIPVLAFYFLLDYKSLTHELYGLVPSKNRRGALRLGRNVGAILQSYVFGQLILCVIAGLLTGIFLQLMNMPYVVVLALFAGVTRAIPIIGPVLSGIPIVLVGLIYSGGHIALPAYLTIFIVVMHFAESKFLLPKLIGYRLHLHPAAVIIVLLVGAEFLGIVGMFLAAPVAAIIREIIGLHYVNRRDSGGLSLSPCGPDCGTSEAS